MSIYLDHVSGNVSASTGSLSINGTVPQPLHSVLTSLSGVSTVTTGLLKLTNGTASIDTTNYVVSGGALGTPSSGVLTNCTGYTYANLTGTVPTWNQNTTGTAAGLSSTLAVSSGGTGATTLAAGNVLLGNGTSAIQTVAPGTSGNVLVSNGTSWVSGSAATASLPTQTGNSGKYLTTDGTTASWGASTGSGNVVLSTSATLVTPNLGTPTALTLTNATGLPVASGISGLGTGVAAFLATPTSANLLAAVTDETGTGAVVFANAPTLISPALGTPASATLTNATGLPISTGVSGLGTGVAAFLATPSSANLISAVTDETGTGSLVFANSPTLVTPNLGTPASGDLSNATNAVAYSIKTASNTVNVSSATAPTTGQVLTATSATAATWQSISALPSQTGNTGKYLTTDGSSASWSSISSGLASTPIKTANYTAAAYELVRVNSTSGVVTITLPTSPADGAIIGVIDVAKTFGVNNVTVVPGAGKTIEGDSTSMILNVNGLYTSFVYISATSNWRILETPKSAGTGTVKPTAIKTANYTAAEYDLVCTNSTSSAFNVTLPVAPLTGTVVGVMDVAGTFGTNNVTVLPGAGATIEGDASFILDVNNTYASFIYFADTTNWRIQNTPGGSIASTGTGSLVNSISPTLVTPNLGTPASGVLTNCTGYAFANLTSTPTTISGYGITNALTTTMLGAASGVAPLGSDSKISSTYLPSYVDDVLEYANYAALPATGETSKIYVAQDTNKIYRWSGSAYIEIATSVGSSDTAVKLATARSISATGDATWTVNFDGSTNVTAALTLANVVTAGTGTKVTYNAKGLITGSTTLTVGDITDIATNYQAKNANLTSLAALSTSTTGLVKLTNGVASLDTSSYLVSGGALGTPSSATLTNATGLPISTGVTGLSTGIATFLGNPTSANLASTVIDETGTGSLVFGTGPTIDTPKITTELRINNTANTFYTGFKTGTISANKIWTLPTADGTANQIMKTDGAGNLGWVDATVAAGSNTQIQFNNSGALGASSSLTWDGTYVSAPYLKSSNSIGDEGGEILLVKPQTNSTIAGTGVTIDVYQNKLRIFEQGGSARGAYIDLTAASAGVGSNLLSASAMSYGTGVTTLLATPTSANLAAAITDETGTGSLVFATSPTLVTPILGTPTSGNFSTGTFTWPTFNQNTTGSAASLTTARNISASGDATWTVSFNGTVDATAAITLANTAVTAGTYGSATQAGTFTVDSKGRLTSASSTTVTPAWSSITSKPTTLSGFGITDGQTLNANLTSLAALSTATTGLVKLTNGVASLDTSGYLTSTSDLSSGINGVAYGIKTATNTVSVSGATAPTTGQVLTATSATTATWQTVSAGGGSLPSQTGNSGKYLTTDGTTASWGTVAGGSGAGSLTSTPVKTAAYTASAYDLVRCNTTGGAFTVTLPASPTDGTQIGIVDIAKTFGTYPLTVAPGAGASVESDSTGVMLDINGTYVALVYTSSLTNWRILATPATTNNTYNSGGLYPTAIKTSAYAASSSELVRCNTSGGAFTVSFPTSPLDGAIIGVVDINNTFSINNLTITPGAGTTIEGDITSYVIDMSSVYISFIYSSSTSNWRLLETPTASPTASIGKSIAMSIAFGG